MRNKQSFRDLPLPPPLQGGGLEVVIELITYSCVTSVINLHREILKQKTIYFN